MEERFSPVPDVSKAVHGRLRTGSFLVAARSIAAIQHSTRPRPAAWQFGLSVAVCSK